MTTNTPEELTIEQQHSVGDRVCHVRTGKVGTIVETHYPGWVDWQPDDWTGHPHGAYRTDPSNLARFESQHMPRIPEDVREAVEAAIINAISSSMMKGENIGGETNIARIRDAILTLIHQPEQGREGLCRVALSKIMSRHASNVSFHDKALAEEAWAALSAVPVDGERL